MLWRPNLATPRERLEELRALKSQSGRRARLNQLRELKAQQAVSNDAAAQPLPEGNAFDAIAEPAMSIASGLGNQVAGGLSAIGTLATGGTLGEAVSDIKGFQENTFTPKTQAGQAGLKAVGDVVQKGLDFASEQTIPQAMIAEGLAGNIREQALETKQNIKDKGFTTVAGDRVFEETGSPLLATVAKISPDIIGAAFALGKIAKANIAGKSAIPSSKVNPDIKNPFTPPTKTQLKIAEKLAEGGTDRTLAKYIADGAGKVKTDKLATTAIKQGFEPGVIAAVKGASKADRAKMLRMVDIMQRGKKNALFQAKNRPTDIAGDSLLKRIQHVRSVNKNAGKRIDAVANTLKGKPVNLDKAINGFADSLDGFGIKLVDNGKGGLVPDFKNSIISPGDRGPLKEVIRQMNIAGRRGTPDGFTAHKMKRIIDNNVTFGKVKTGLSGDTERVLKEFRRNIDESLDSTFPEYNKVNTIYSETIGALDSIQNAAGTKMNLAGGNADKALGTRLRGLMSNVQSRINLVDAVDEIETISRKFGSNFDDDIATQMLFADELDAVFGPVARTSLGGEIGKNVKTGLDAAAGNKTVAGVAIDLAAKGADKIRGVNEENAFKSINELLRRN